MDLTQAKSALKEQQKQFAETVQQPNTLQRNVVLAGHRTEIARLEKLIAQSAKTRRPAVS